MFLDVFEMKLQDIGIWICNRCGNMFFLQPIWQYVCQKDQT
jgi:ribosomal protein L37AE/L43A